MFCAQQACWPYLVSSKSDCKYVAELRQIRGGTTCIRSATCLYLTKITAKMWLYQQEQTYPQSGLPRPHKATVRPSRASRRKSTPRSTIGLGFDQVCPLLTSPLRARRPRRTAVKFPRFRVAPLLRARMAISASLGVCWVRTDDRAGGSRRGCHCTRVADSLLFHFV